MRRQIKLDDVELGVAFMRVVRSAESRRDCIAAMPSNANPVGAFAVCMPDNWLPVVSFGWRNAAPLASFSHSVVSHNHAFLSRGRRVMDSQTL